MKITRYKHGKGKATEDILVNAPIYGTGLLMTAPGATPIAWQLSTDKIDGFSFEVEFSGEEEAMKVIQAAQEYMQRLDRPGKHEQPPYDAMGKRS